jgi:hypothetical protein
LDPPGASNIVVSDPRNSKHSSGLWASGAFVAILLGGTITGKGEKDSSRLDRAGERADEERNNVRVERVVGVS